MYATAQERLETAREMWQQAAAQVEALSRVLTKTERALDAANHTEYDLVYGKLELLRAQYRAVCDISDQRWAHFSRLSTAAHRDDTDPRIDGYNVEFLGAQPPRCGEDY